MKPEELSRALLTSMNEPLGYVTPDFATTSLPTPSVDDILAAIKKFRDKQKEVDKLMIRALVDLINQSPPSMPSVMWARKFAIPFPKFVAMCHEEEDITDEFRGRLAHYYSFVIAGGKPW